MNNNLVSPVGILGFGVEGQSTLRYLFREGVKEIIVMDKNPVNLPEAPIGINVKVFSGENYLEGLRDCVTVVRSAGVYPMSQDLFKFQMNGGMMTSQIQLFLEQTKSTKTVGVTGTLGKGSTVSMISHILDKCGKANIIGGNFGVPALDLLEDDSADRISILELSSFQLMTLSLSPDVGVVLRVSTEHLDWHTSVEEYRDAKANLVRWQKSAGTCVYLKDAAPTAKIASESPAKNKLAVSFGDGDANIEGSVLTIGNDKLFLSDCKVRGIYQLENMAAATLACTALGIKVADAFEALKTYETLPFRMEFKGEKNGIEFYNDSYATRPDATIAATGSMKRPFALILGGSEKNADFTELSNILVKDRPNLKRVALIGATAERMLDDLKKAGVDAAGIKTAIFPTLEEAFADSLNIGEGGTVIMSPACASFGLFKNYKVRGQVFDKLVADLG
ncbi:MULTISPECIES: UDP-N-acetylmuramoyl-L-alanine--D-glutamate ligase [unclassified Fibrobacter]|uniref:UDP-N-acetylmuramoyl-L-alanine--D-glutamate ligase n=1 Tax=unclassified Fibrobacter TaxID=2634177 RepID=UPI000D6A92E8|nr:MULTISPECIES: UDP-N-acetylmuramoyl-L-alanine--D-glutamate ligase [unclassified Fibrobacter]PWJ71823.1 UDP-N-acetylmuramoylalanine--D-glutamate ligase [Fibrobacter sp. UWR4]PZW73738.1 UDP-N-acetylmuramoylalanine--D-glutamate ligase [Fibrobacter sp. UWR1]